MGKTKICAISLAAYPLLARQDMELIGGAELQSVLLGKELARYDFDVSFVVLDHGQESPETIDDIKVVKSYPADTPLGIRFSTVRHIWRALRQADADIYYGFRGIAGVVALFCCLKKRKLVLNIPHDMDVQGKPATKRNFYDWLWWFDLRRADCVIAQTEYQHAMLKSNFKRDSVIIKAFIPIESKEVEKDMPPVVMWAARIGPEWKQPEVFLQLAKAIPDTRFQMIGGPSENIGLYEKIKEQASDIPNLEFVGFVHHHEIGRYFERASIFVNTSTAEGFSNTFLEAWSRYTPVVSLNVDPGEIICQQRLGFHSRTVEQMVAGVKLLLSDNELRQELGRNGRRYVEQEHELGRVVEQFVRLFNQLVK